MKNKEQFGQSLGEGLFMHSSIKQLQSAHFIHDYFQ